MKKMSMAAVLICVALTVYAQTKPRLGILPFTGGSGRDGDTIATLFASSRELGDEFTIIPRTGSVEAIMREQQFQRTSGLTDTDTIARLGRQANANYVVSGHIARLGSKNLLLISIVNVETMEQITGDYREYGTITDVISLLPDMAAQIINSVRQRGSLQRADRPTLAVSPLDIQDEQVEQEDAELLARILATEIANTHRYAVLPRSTTIHDAIEKEQTVQKSGLTDQETLAIIGRATNAKYVLSGTITNLGRLNLFTVQILDIETAAMRSDASGFRQYRNLEDGIGLMKELAQQVTGVADEEAAAREQREAEAAVERERREAQEAVDREQQEVLDAKKKRLAVTKMNSFGANFDLGFGNVFNEAITLAANFNGSFSFLPYTFIDIGINLGYFEHEYKYEHQQLEYPFGYFSNKTIPISYFLLYPYAHFNLYLPLGDIFGIYAGAGAGYIVAFGESADTHYENDGYNIYTFDDPNAHEKTLYALTFDASAGLMMSNLDFLYWRMIGLSWRTPVDDFGTGTIAINTGFGWRF
jgi:TolB-like protein